MNGTNLRQFLQKSQHWDNPVWNLVEFQCLGSYAYRNLRNKKIYRVSKLMHCWLITGSKIAVDSDLRCPQRLAPMETQDHHVWQCKDARAHKARYISMTELWSKLVTVAGSFVTWTILISCCKQWLEHNAVSCNALPAGYVQKLIPTTILPHIMAALQ